jgi:hypothetical protein
MGGTGLWPVVSGVAPETFAKFTLFMFDQLPVNYVSPTKFGGTPNLTRETRVLP